MAARHLFGFVAGAVLALALSGCGASEPSIMPDVTGKQLDVAKSDVERAGHGGDIEVVGGGLFGVVNESNWMVCEQTPAAGAEISSPRLVVDRECGAGGGATSEQTASPAPATPSPSVDPIDTTLAEVLDRINVNDLPAGEVYRFDAELMDRSEWFEGATGHYSVTVKVPGSTFADNQDYFVLLDDASQAADWVPGSVMTFVVENLELEVSGDTGSGWLKVLSAEPAS
ncbi:PASTA domain-containing protein [Microbacter sp. GSS18]|nr:PASTA domain-containing protein [Microbacter sp. GSS18]